jgi:molybdenum cofactor cytidylyltransferase
MHGTAIVPAAGRGERFGGGKLLASLDGVPLLDRTLRSLLEAGLRVIVVTTPDADLDSVSLLRDPRVRRVVNEDPARGMFSSIRIGLDALDDAGGPVLVLPADMPFVRSATVARVRDECARRLAVIVPTYDGRRGHPIAIPIELTQALADAETALSLKDALHAIGAVRVAFPVNDPGVLRDVDVPADLEPVAGADRPIG